MASTCTQYDAACLRKHLVLHTNWHSHTHTSSWKSWHNISCIDAVNRCIAGTCTLHPINKVIISSVEYLVFVRRFFFFCFTSSIYLLFPNTIRAALVPGIGMLALDFCLNKYFPFFRLSNCFLYDRFVYLSPLSRFVYLCCFKST